MANTKISELGTAGVLDGTEEVPIVQGGVTKRTTAAKLSSAIIAQASAPSSPATNDLWLDTDEAGLSGATDWTLRTGALWQNMPRNLAGVLNCALISGTLHLTGVNLTAGQTVTGITFSTGVTTVTPTNGWFGLFNAARELLAISADSLTEVWTAFNFKTKAMTTPYVVPTTGLYYAGAMYAAATAPTLMGIASNTGQSPTSLGSPVLNGRSTTGQTTPPTPGAFTAAVLGGAIGTPWVEIS